MRSYEVGGERKKEGGETIKHRNKNYGVKGREEGKGRRRVKERGGMKTKRGYFPRETKPTHALKCHGNVTTHASV